MMSQRTVIVTQPHAPWDLALTERRLAVRFARQYAWKWGCRVEDLEQVGLLALHRAALRFDPCRGVAFGAYAWQFVRDSVRRAARREVANRSELVEAEGAQPSDAADDVVSWVALVERLPQDERVAVELLAGGVEVRHIAARMGVSRWTVQRLLRRARRRLVETVAASAQTGEG